MQRILLLFLFCLPVLSFSQETVEVVKKFNGSSQISEVENVLKSNPSIKQGFYISFYKISDEAFKKNEKIPLEDRPNIQSTGYFKSNLKDSTWTEYYNYLYKTNGDSISRIKETGNYKHGNKIGIWIEFFNTADGMVMRKYNYTTHSLVGKPIPYIHVGVNYPPHALDSAIQGTVEIKYHVNKECIVDSILVVKGVGGGCTKICIQRINEYWESIKGALQKYYRQNSPCDKDKSIIQQFNFKMN